MRKNADLRPLNDRAGRLGEDVCASPCSPSHKLLQTPLSNLAGATDLSFVAELNGGPELMAVSQPQAACGWGTISPPPRHSAPRSNDHFAVADHTSLCQVCSSHEIKIKILKTKSQTDVTDTGVCQSVGSLALSANIVSDVEMRFLCYSSERFVICV